MGLHSIGIKPPRPDSASARLDTPPIPAGRRGNEASGTGKIFRMKMKNRMKMNTLISSSLHLLIPSFPHPLFPSSPHPFIPSCPSPPRHPLSSGDSRQCWSAVGEYAHLGAIYVASKHNRWSRRIPRNPIRNNQCFWGDQYAIWYRHTYSRLLCRHRLVQHQ